ncbi:hypothetical protein INR49_019337, partial [Caranx melampygus]
VSHHVDEGGADAGVAVAAEERVGVAVGDGALAVLVDVVVAAAVGVEALRLVVFPRRSHDVHDDGTSGRHQHDMTFDLVVVAYDPLDG